MQNIVFLSFNFCGEVWCCAAWRFPVTQHGSIWLSCPTIIINEQKQYYVDHLGWKIQYPSGLNTFSVKGTDGCGSSWLSVISVSSWSPALRTWMWCSAEGLGLSFCCLQCSVSCGTGIKERQIVCVDQNQTQIQDESCAHLIPPRTQKACRAGPCPAWRANQWTAVCDITCNHHHHYY